MDGATPAWPVSPVADDDHAPNPSVCHRTRTSCFALLFLINTAQQRRTPHTPLASAACHHHQFHRVSPSIAPQGRSHGRLAQGSRAVPGGREVLRGPRQGGRRAAGGVEGRVRRRRGEASGEGAGPRQRRRPGVAVLAQAGGGQGRAAHQGAGVVRVRDQRARPREPRLPPPQRQADGERPRRPRPLHKQGVQREPGQAAGHHGGDLRADPARPGAQRRPLRGHLQLLLRRLRPHLRAGALPHLRGVLPRRHRRLGRLRGRLRPGQAQPDRLPLQDLLHLLPPRHPRPAPGAALHARPAVPRRRGHARRQGRRAARLHQELHQLIDGLVIPRLPVCQEIMANKLCMCMASFLDSRMVAAIRERERERESDGLGEEQRLES